MSSFLKAFNAIKAQIETVAEIKTVRLWNSQIDNHEREQPYTRPACFIEFKPTGITTDQPTQKIGQNVSRQQKINTIITIHYEDFKYEDETTSLPIIDANFQKIYYVLQGFTKGALADGYFQPLLRVDVRFDSDHDQVLDWQMDFETMLQECGEEEELTLIAGGTITPDIDRDFDIDSQTIRTGDGIF